MNEKRFNEMKSRVERSYHGTSFSPEKRAETFMKDVTSTLERMKEKLGDLFDEEKILNLYEDIISANGRCMSSMITGPANFPVERNRKALNAYDKKWQNLQNYLNKMVKVKEKKEKEARVQEAGGELQVLKNKLASLERSQEMMKQANKILRQKPKNLFTEEKKQKLLEAGFTEKQATEIFKPDCMGTIGFAGFSLTNNNAKIKNTRARIEEMEKKQNATNKEWSFDQNGIKVTVTVDFEIDRIVIRHEDKPSREVIQELKKLGMKWSPRNQGWQRKITNNALWVLKRSNYWKV